MERKTQFKISKVFPRRWSPRAMSGESISKEQLFALFEAARWAPSAFNNQPWRFIYAMNGTKEWNLFFNLLIDFNKMWAKNASNLILVISKKSFELNNKPNPTHSFETGAAWMSLALQGSMDGLVTHTISGFDYEKARTDLKIPDDYNIEAMVVIGKEGKKEDLSEDLQKMEVQSDRKNIEEFVFEGGFNENP